MNRADTSCDPVIGQKNYNKKKTIFNLCNTNYTYFY